MLLNGYQLIQTAKPLKVSKKMDLFETIKIPVLGMASTTASLYISIESITAMAQCVAAVGAVFVAVLTIILTIKKIKNINKNGS